MSFQSSEFLINTILPLRSRPCKSSFVSMFWSFMFTFADVYHIICERPICMSCMRVCVCSEPRSDVHSVIKVPDIDVHS